MNTAKTASPRGTRTFAAAALVALTCVANVGTAQASDSEPPARKVSFSDLDVNTEAGAKVLYARLRFAADEVCRPYERTGIMTSRAWLTCVNHALASAVQQINKPTLTALYNMSGNRRASSG
jgi:UrcA family protein